MLIKFFARGRGSGSGPVEYLTNREAEGREDHAPEVLRGCPDSTIELIDSIDREWRYTSGVISFAREDAPTEAQQAQVMDEFEQTAFAGLEPDQYQILWVRHQHTSGGRVELHFVTPRVELTTGKALNIAPPGWQKLYDPLRDALNAENGWARPEDPDRARTLQIGTQEAVERLQSREAIHGYVVTQIEAGAVYDRSSLLESLQGAGLEINRQGKNYVTAQDSETGDKFRLKGTIYEQDWTLEQQLERTLGREAGEGQERDRGIDLERAQEARRELSSRIENRVRHHQERYPRSEQDDSADLGRDAALAALDNSILRGGHRSVLDLALGGDMVVESRVEPDQSRNFEGAPSPYDAPKPDWARADSGNLRRAVSGAAERGKERVELPSRQAPVHETTAAKRGIDDHGEDHTFRARAAAFRQRIAEWYRQGNNRLEAFFEGLRQTRAAEHNAALERSRESTRDADEAHGQHRKNTRELAGSYNQELEKLRGAIGQLRDTSEEVGDAADHVAKVIEQEKAREIESYERDLDNRDDGWGFRM